MDDYYHQRAKIAKALGHPIRIKLVEIIEERGGECVCELTEQVDVNQPAVSKHLKVLQEAGILQSRKDGLEVYYEVTAPCIQAFNLCIKNILKKNI